MSESEIARIKARIAKEYLVARWGLTGLAQGTTKHAFIAARMKRIGEGHKELEAHIGNGALGVVVETLENVPEVPTREQIRELLQYAFGHEEDIDYLLNDINKLWFSSDLLEAIFGEDNAFKIVNAQPGSTS